MSRIGDFFRKWLYAVPFGIKGADDVIFGESVDDSANNIGVHQQVTDERVAKHLLKGEVTQPVKDLRYRTYKVAHEAEAYEYAGDGTANNVGHKGHGASGRYKFSQSNRLDYGTVGEGLKYLDDNSRHLFEFTYKSFVRFKLDRYITEADIDINDKEKKVVTILHFSRFPTPDDQTSKQFINELDKLVGADKRQIERSEILNEIDTMAFSTYYATDEENFVNYCFTGGAAFVSIDASDTEFLITFKWDAYLRVPFVYEDIYYSENMAKKYENREMRDTPITFAPYERKRYCEACGKEISVYDGDILEYEGIGALCQDCYRKLLESEEK